MDEKARFAPRKVATSRQIESLREMDEYTLLVISGCAGLSVVPFLFYRLLQSDWLIAAIDFSAVLVCAGLFFYVYRTRRTTIPGFLISTMFLVVMNATVYLKGPALVFWCFPVTVAMYYLLPYRQALILVSIGLLPVLYQAYQWFEALEFAIFFVTLIVTTTLAYIFSARSFKQNQQLKIIATHDSLTGVGNRRGLEEKLQQVVAIQRRVKFPVSMIVLDLDRFKNINDTYGHSMGDEVLVRFSELVQSRIRDSDYFFRYGGEEFVLISTGAKLDAAIDLAEELRLSVANRELVAGIRVTVSAGVAELRDNDDRDSWLKRADTALYEAKDSGRNKVCSSDESIAAVVD